MNPKDNLMAARKLIEKPENWTQGAFARDASGNPVEVYDEKAVCFCILGAIWRVSEHNTIERRAAQDALHVAAFRVTGEPSVLLVNDSGTHEEVIRVFDAAIERAS